MRYTSILVTLSLFFLGSGCQNHQITLPAENTFEALPYVNPMLGVDGGNVFGGVSLPFSMMRLGPDVQPNNITNGYRSNRPIKGFSHTHLSGTGGGPRYGNFLTIPQVGPVDIEDYVSLKKVNEYSAPGFYQVRLARKIGDVNVKLSATERVGFHEYEPYTWRGEDILDFNILLDISHGNTRGKANDHRCTGGDLQILSDSTLSGWASFIGGWGSDSPYKIYFYAIFDTPFQASGVWEGDEFYPNEQKRQDRSAINKEFSDFGAYVSFKARQNQKFSLKLGISFISEEKAKANIQNELPHWNFNQTRVEAEEKWDDALTKIKVSGGLLEDRVKFYSMLRNTMIMPTDVDGENPKWDSDAPHYWEHYCLWDVYRTVMPLHTLIIPERQTEILNSLLDIYEYEGWLPDSWIAGHYSNVQGGSNADIVFADAMVKGLSGFDKQKAYEAMKKNGKVASDNPEKYGRRLDDYIRFGYLLPRSNTGAVSRTIHGSGD
ncbi:MAG: glycoside hydrolase domain-containing protein, partial [Bacteroidota bacterium]